MNEIRMTAGAIEYIAEDLRGIGVGWNVKEGVM